MNKINQTSLRTSKKKMFLVVVTMLCSVVIIFISLSTFSIFRNKQSYLNDTRIRSRAQAQLLAENSASMIYAADLTLLSLRSLIRHQDSVSHSHSVNAIKNFEPEIRLLPQIEDIVLLDAKGDILYSSQGTKKFEIEAFDKHRDAWLEFFVDAVIFGKDAARIVISRRIENQKNEFMGVLIAVVNPDFFYDHFDDSLDIDMDAIVLVDMKGRILTDWFRESDPGKKFIGTNIREIPIFSAFSEIILSGGGRRTLENSRAIVSTHQLKSFPFHVAVSYNHKNVLKKWRREANREIATVFVTTLIAAFALILVNRYRQHREKAEQALLDHHAHLEETIAERTKKLTETNRELIQKNAALQNALAEVKTLSGLLPICSHCKKIRDDSGYWNQLESYIHKHTDAEFSHSICKDCAEKHYPDLDIYEE